MIYWNEKQDVQRQLFRQTMKYLEHQLSVYEIFFRSHRITIVNLMAIKRLSGNSLGYHLTVEGIDEKIPVSRDKGRELLDRLTSTIRS